MPAVTAPVCLIVYRPHVRFADTRVTHPCRGRRTSFPVRVTEPSLHQRKFRVIRSLEPHGVRALLLLNAHGGNELRALVRELQPARRILLAIANWWQAGNHDVFDEPGDHAGELETAAILHVAPHLVRAREAWGKGAERSSVFDGVRQGWAWLPRRWTQVTTDTGVGDPRAATAEKGAQFVAQAVERISALCNQLATADPNALYR